MTAKKRASDEDRSLTFAARIGAPNVREGLQTGPNHSVEALDGNRLRPLEDSAPLIGDQERLRERASRDGFLFFRGLVPEDLVLVIRSIRSKESVTCAHAFEAAFNWLMDSSEMEGKVMVVAPEQNAHSKLSRWSRCTSGQPCACRATVVFRLLNLARMEVLLPCEAQQFGQCLAAGRPHRTKARLGGFVAGKPKASSSTGGSRWAR